jgi:hypothetical protein
MDFSAKRESIEAIGEQKYADPEFRSQYASSLFERLDSIPEVMGMDKVRRIIQWHLLR